MNRQVAKSKICFLWIDGLNDQLNWSKGLTSRNRAALTGDQTLLAHQEFILKDQFQELGVAELVTGGFLQPHVQGLGQARQPQVV